MVERTDEEIRQIDSKRREAIKKGLIATGAIGVGLIGLSGVANASGLILRSNGVDYQPEKFATTAQLASYAKLDSSNQPFTNGLQNTGSTDKIQFKVIANSVQTNLVEGIYTSDGTTVIRSLDASGNLGLRGAGTIFPTVNSTAALKVGQADKTVFVSFDSNNKRIRIGDATVPTATLDVLGKLTFDSTNGYLTVTNISVPLQSTISSGLAVNNGLVSGANGVFVAKGATDQALLQTDTANDRVGIGTTTPAVKLDINSNSIRIQTAKTPSSAGDTGVAGQICWDANYIYICTATNTWKRASIATW